MIAATRLWSRLSGVPTDGVDTVRLIYMDEAGTGDPQKEPYLVVGGVLVHADNRVKHLENALRQIRAEYCPDAPSDLIFHATTLYSGASGDHYFSRDRWTKEKRWMILDRLVELPAIYDLPVVHGSTARSEGQTKFVDFTSMSAKKRLEVQYALAFVLCALTADWWMRKYAFSRGVAMIIAEDHPEVKESLRQMQAFCHNPSLAGNLIPGWEAHLPFRKIIETVHYAPKKASALLQLADVCTFVIKRKLMSQRTTLPEGDRFYGALASQHYQPQTRPTESQP